MLKISMINMFDDDDDNDDDDDAIAPYVPT